MHDLLIVIPCLNEERMLEPLLRQFGTEDPEALIVVADGGSTDASKSIIRALSAEFGNIRLLDNPQRVQSAAINQAVRVYGEGRDWLLRVDAHAGYPKSYAAILLNAARARGAESVVVPMVSEGRGWFQTAAAAAQNSVLGTGGSPHRHLGEGRYVDHGHHALMRLDLFRRVGGYRLDMPHNEDAELDLRLSANGARIWLEPQAAITYHPRRTLRELWRQYLGYGRGRARTIRLHGQRPKMRQLLPLLPLVALALLPLAFWHPVFALPLVGWLLLCLGGGLAVGFKEGNFWSCLSGIPAGAMHLAWAIGFVGGLSHPLKTEAQYA